MIAQMSLVSLSVKLALLPGVVGVLGPSIVRAGLTDGWGDGVWFLECVRGCSDSNVSAKEKLLLLSGRCLVCHMKRKMIAYM
jgi:hypothetical protein